MSNTDANMAPTTSNSETRSYLRKAIWPVVVLFLLPVAVAVFFYAGDEFDASRLPEHSLLWSSLEVANRNGRILAAAERLGDGQLWGPEDIAFEPDDDDNDGGVIYTGCLHGWIKKVNLARDATSVTVENFAHTGGRPLGVAIGPDKHLIVADAYKGLLRVTKEGRVELLTDEAEGVKFRLTDGIDVAADGVIYFTDASYKYNFSDHMLDILEGRPYGRLLSFDPRTKLTQVLLRDLYFANGIALSPQQDFLVFCETPLRRCRKYHIKGERKGLVEDFIDNLPGYPDNIRYDGDGHFWIASPTARTLFWKILFKYPIARKITAILGRYMEMPNMQKDGRIISVTLEGQADALYSDPALSMITVGVKIGTHLYYGSLEGSYIGCLDLTQHPAKPA